MPFVGLKDGETVLPVEVGDGDIVSCPGCSGPMAVRVSHKNGSQFISRHFYHTQNSSSGDGSGDGESGSNVGCAESDVHKRMKNIAYAKLERMYPDGLIELERPIGSRYADVCVTFDSPKHPYGKGIVVEVQHKNKGKNIGKVSREYFEHGYSVLWAYQSDMEGHDMTFDEDRFWKIWPRGVPFDRNWEPPTNHLQKFIDEAPPSVEIEVPFPLEFFWEVAEAEQAKKQQQAKREDTSGSTYGKIWVHGKGKNVAWFTVHKTNAGNVQLRLWQKTKGQRSTEKFSVIVDECAIEQVKSFIAESKTALDQSSAYKSREDWHTIATAWLTDNSNEQTTWLSFAKPPNGRIQLTLGRKTEYNGSEKATVARRKGDEHRLEPLVEALESAFADKTQ